MGLRVGYNWMQIVTSRYFSPIVNSLRVLFACREKCPVKWLLGWAREGKMLAFQLGCEVDAGLG